MSVHSSMRREIERAIDEAVNPKGMATHSGMARINASILQRLLAIADETEALRRDAERYWWLLEGASIAADADTSTASAAVDASKEPATEPAIRARGEVPR
jgi:hypothetical protein